MVKANEVVAIDNAHSVAILNANNLDRLNGLLVLNEARGWSMIRKTKAIQNKVVVVGVIAKITTISKILDPVTCFCSQPLHSGQSPNTYAKCRPKRGDERGLT